MDDVVNEINKDYLYELLGCDELSTEEQILTEYKIKAKSLHPDKNSGDQETTEKFVRLSKAKDILCNKEQRKNYDAWRRCGIDVPFETWLLTDSHFSFHWAPEPKKEKMLESCDKKTYNTEEGGGSRSNANSACQTGRTAKPSFTWEKRSSCKNTKLNEFRNYMI